MAWLASILTRNGSGGPRTVFWVCPRNFEFPEIAATFSPELVVADVIDDHRAWVLAGSSDHRSLTQNYEDILGLSDLVLASTQSVQESMQAFAQEVHLVPNACEPPGGGSGSAGKPKELRRMKGPILGYAGNLSSRIDIKLLDHVATVRPGWSIALIGSAHLSRDVMSLDRHPNVHFLGVKPYAEAQRYIRHFDVGLVPHLDNELTRSMHPLKVFVYGAMGVPVVSTQVANLPSFGRMLEVAESHDDFVAKIEGVLRAGRLQLTDQERQLIDRESWPSRIDTILPLVQERLGDASN